MAQREEPAGLSESPEPPATPTPICGNRSGHARRRRGVRVPMTTLSNPPRGHSTMSFTQARLSQQLDNGDIGEDDVAFQHGLKVL